MRVVLITVLRRLGSTKLALAITAFVGLGLIAVVPISSGPFASPAYAQSCGGEGQKACFPTKCNGRLVLDFIKGVCIRKDNDIVNKVKDGAAKAGQSAKQALKRPNTCGGLGQRPCPPPHIPSCNGRLVQHFIINKCIQNDADIVNLAKNTVRESGNLLGFAIRSIGECGLDTLMRSRSSGGQAVVAQRILGSRCLPIILAEAKRAGYQTVTLGASGGGAFGVGFEGENGFAFDVNGTRPAATYHTLGVKFLSLGAGPAVTVGMYKKPNNAFGGDAHGATVGFAAVGGSGASAFFNYDTGAVEGVSAFLTSGARAELAYVRNTTEVLPTRIAAAPPSYARPVAAQEPSDAYYPEPAPYQEPDYYPAGGYAPPPTKSELMQGAANNIANGLAAAIIARGEARRAQKARDAKRTMLKLCNRTKSKRIAIGYAYWKEASIGGAPCWFSKAWYVAKRKKCETIFLPDGPSGLGMDYFVKIWAFDKKTGKTWTGNSTPICADMKNAFAFRNADIMPCEGGDLKRLNTIAMEAGRGENLYNFIERLLDTLLLEEVRHCWAKINCERKQ